MRRKAQGAYGQTGNGLSFEPPGLKDDLHLSPSERDSLSRLLMGAFRGGDPDLGTWSKAFRMEEGEPLDFEAFPFQVELYEAFGDRSLASVDVMKSSQCGISATAVSHTLHAADVWGANVIYVLPTSELAQQFSDTRVKRAIEDSPYLRARVRSVDNKGVKRVGEHYVYFVGSGSEAQALSVPADVLIFDEYDRLDHRRVPIFTRRLNAPTSMRLIRRFSNPTFPQEGIHRLFLDSDQRRWVITCPGCGHGAWISFEPLEEAHYVDQEQVSRVCGKCRRPLPDEAVAEGRWVAHTPGSEHRGYHISRLIVPGEDVAALIAAHHLSAEGDVQAHYNFDLGEPYAPKGGSLTEDIVKGCRRKWDCPDRYDGEDWVTMGVDVGKVLHVRISRWLPSGKALPVYLGEVGEFRELARLMDRYGVNFALVDERPEERAARAFMDAYRGRVKLVRWSGEEQHEELRVDDDQGLVIARRTWACDQTVDSFEEQRRLLPQHLPEGYESQCTAPHRMTETTSRGQKVARYTSTRADHYFFCETYDLLAKLARGGPAADASGPPPEFFTPRHSRIWGELRPNRLFRRPDGEFPRRRGPGSMWWS